MAKTTHAAPAAAPATTATATEKAPKRVDSPELIKLREAYDKDLASLDNAIQASKAARTAYQADPKNEANKAAYDKAKAEHARCIVSIKQTRLAWRTKRDEERSKAAA